MDESNSDQAHHHAPSTVTDALRHPAWPRVHRRFRARRDELHSERGDASCRVDEAVVEHLFRFEGPSDPGDEMIVFGLRDPATGVRGTLATAPGHAADPELGRHLADLSRRFG